MDHCHRKKGIETQGKTFPTDDQAAILFLEPGKGTLGLKAWNVLLDRSPTWGLALPDPFRDLRPDAAAAELLTEVLRIIALVGDEDVRPFPGASTPAGPHTDGIQEGYDLGAFIAVSRRCAVRQGHAGGIGQAVDEDPLAFSATGDPLTAAFARGKRRRRRRHTASESCHAPQRCQEFGPASGPGSHRLASAATTDAWHSSRPIAARTVHHTNGSR